jgi:dihydroorotase
MYHLVYLAITSLLIFASPWSQTSPDVDVFDREARFIEEILKPLVARFPDLKIVSEHITTKQVGAQCSH